MKIKDYTNQKIDHVRVLSYAGKINGYNSWKCVCDCGKKVTLPAYRFTFKRVSCGCQGDNVADFFICKGCGKEIPNINGARYRIWCDECKKIEQNRRKEEYNEARRSYRPVKKKAINPEWQKDGVFAGMAQAQITELARRNHMKLQTYIAWCEGTGKILYPPDDVGRYVDWQADPRFT